VESLLKIDKSITFH